MQNGNNIHDSHALSRVFNQKCEKMTVRLLKIQRFLQKESLCTRFPMFLVNPVDVSFIINTTNHFNIHVDL